MKESLNFLSDNEAVAAGAILLIMFSLGIIKAIQKAWDRFGQKR